MCVNKCICIHAVCASSRVGFIALGGRYWSDLRLRWDKVLEGESVCVCVGLEVGGHGSEDSPQACYQQSRVMGCVCGCLRHLELEP